ncbi:hypothetical protein FVEN_g6703 [Fusarium venenatum]|nr:hypothetical protein FVEN_g6703 [Fusarium venenatum]
MTQKVRTVAIVGCGVIGMGWAVLFMSCGLKVIISDPAESAHESLKSYLKQARPFFEEHGGFDKLASNYEFVLDIMPRLSEVDFIQEKDPSRILIGHPFNPPHLIPLVEVVPHPGTSPDSISSALAFYRSLGKKPILLHQEVPGFVSNRLQAAINNEAYSLISRGVVSARDLDMAVTQGPGLRWALTGPIVTNALGGGGGPHGFAERFERLGPAIRGWEDDILKNRFDWSEDRVKTLQNSVNESLNDVDWNNLVDERDLVLLEMLAAKSKTKTMGINV